MASCLPEFIAALCWKYIHFTVVSDCLAWSCSGSASRSWVTDSNLISREQWNRKIEVSQSEDSLKHYVIMFTLSRSNKKRGGGCPFMKINSSLFLNSSQFPVFFLQYVQGQCSNCIVFRLFIEPMCYFYCLFMSAVMAQRRCNTFAFCFHSWFEKTKMCLIAKHRRSSFS